MAWTGPGLTAFAGPAGSPERGGGGKKGQALRSGAREPVPFRLDSLRDVLDAFSGDSPPDSMPCSAVLRQFFEAGGESCLFLDEPRLGDPLSAWIGEDGGPGRRTGVHALSEIDEVGSIVLPPSRSPRRRELLLDLASRRPDHFFFLEEAGVDGPDSSREQPSGAPARGPLPRDAFLGENVFVLQRQETPRREDAGLGALLGFLEATGFKEEAPSRRLQPGRSGGSEAGLPGSGAPPWLSKAGALRLEAWRRWAGLRRSIDIGTRWTVFEVNHPLLWGRVEREVRAFLLRLERLGLVEGALDGEGSDAGREVECGPWDGRGSKSDGLGGRIRIRVRARLSGPYSTLDSAKDSWTRQE
jgi:hypothetical protein